MSAMILVFVAALTLFAVHASHAIDRNAVASTTRQVSHGVRDELDRLLSFNLDYAKWDEAAEAVSQQDFQWLVGVVP
jgi:sensor domain CHASE-containing protein